MIDIHTHILPGVDDGSRSVEQSLQMLRLEKQQGVTQVALTPHFYALEDSPQRFLARRQSAYEKLMEQWTEALPRLHLGAEVQYFEGICGADLEPLLIGGSDLLLLEMPFRTWSRRMTDDILELSRREDIRVVLAHVERYLHWQDRDTLPMLLDRGIWTQCNAGFFLEFSTRRKALQMLQQGQIHLLGSDCHDLQARPPRLGQARERIEKKLGTAFMNRLIEDGDAALYEKNT